MNKKGLRALFQAVELTQGECWKTILAFSFPIIISYLLQQVYTISDAAIVGQTLTAQEVRDGQTIDPMVVEGRDVEGGSYDPAQGVGAAA